MDDNGRAWDGPDLPRSAARRAPPLSLGCDALPAAAATRARGGLLWSLWSLLTRLNAQPGQSTIIN
ncbi:hypothetical protein E4U21_005102 [Claviceps maximensis]|nr:hypothetical protein E4U21_005102 [Claviceps maximensis]